jgi:hypothetical protein
MSFIQSINVMGIETDCKLVYFFKCFITINYYLHVSEHNDWLGKVLSLWFAVIVLLPNACFERSIHLDDGDEKTLRLEGEGFEYLYGRAVDGDIAVDELHLLEEVGMGVDDGIG